MALEIKGLQRVFKFKKDSMELVLDDPNSELSVNEVMDFYSMTYPELTTATVHGPEWEDDKAVYRFKTTIGVKGKRYGQEKKDKETCRQLSEQAKDGLARLIILSVSSSHIRRGTSERKRRILPPPGSTMLF